jgi:methylaspartate mutase epsilon subunit
MSFACLEAAPGLPPVEDIIGYLSQLCRPSMASCLAKADRTGEVLIQPRSGVGSQQKMIALLDVLNRPNTADCLTLTIDSYTRLLKFATAHRLLLEAPEQLNGYPLVAHGYRAVREITERYNRPIQVRHGSPDGRRLFAESVAGGIQSYEGGGISYNLPYCRDVPIEHSLRAWQEIDQACGALEKSGFPIDREFFGPLSAVLMPPSVSLAIVFLEAILAAREGCRCLSLAYPQSGNIIQDVAALQTIRVLAKRYLGDTANVYPVLHEFMGVFPQDVERAQTLIFFGGLTARLGRATKIISKTSQEAIGIPDAEVNAEGIRRTRLAYEEYLSFVTVPPALVEEEAYWIQRETCELVDPVLSEPDLITAIVRAFHDGRLDIPFPSNREAHGRVVPVRDNEIAIRFADTGNLPFSQEVKAHHKAKCGQLISGRPLFKCVRDSIMYFAEPSGKSVR